MVSVEPDLERALTPTQVRARKLHVLAGTVSVIACIVLAVVRSPTHGPVRSVMGLILGITLMAMWPLDAMTGHKRSGLGTTLGAALGLVCTILAARDLFRLLF